MIRTRLLDYARRPVTIVFWTMPAFVWFLGVVCAGALWVGVVYLVSSSSSWSIGGWPMFVWVSVAVLFVLLMSVLLRALFPGRRSFTIFVLVLAALSFAANTSVLDHMVFAPATWRTVITLWLCFGALALSLFAERFPRASVLLSPLLVIGACVSLAYAVLLAPVMLFSWLLVLFGGLGFLPYSPLFASAAFGIALWKIIALNQGRFRTLSVSSALGAGVVFCAYLTWFHLEWRNGARILSEPLDSVSEPAGPGGARLDADLPEWARRAAQLRRNHVTELLLQPAQRDNAFFEQASLFDPVAYLVSVYADWLLGVKTRGLLSESESARALRLLFGKGHSDLERLWRGHSLITTDVDSHVQLHPELRVAYVEMTVSVLNENSAGDRSFLDRGLRGSSLFAPPAEAIYTISLPRGSVCTRLSLWIDGELRPARMTFRENARLAYRTIVGAERRDQSYVEWLEGDRLRVRVFPVNAERYRTFIVGIIVPLDAASGEETGADAKEGGRLIFRAPRLEGPVLDFTKHRVTADVFSSSPAVVEGQGISMSRADKTTMSGRWTGKTGNDAWSLVVPASPVQGHVSTSIGAYDVLPLQKKAVPYAPDAVLIALNDTLPRDTWRAVVRAVHTSGYPVYLLSNQWFHSRIMDELQRFIDTSDLPPFNLYPLHFAPDHGIQRPVWITSSEPHSVSIGELRESPRFTELRRFVEKQGQRAPVVVLNGRESEYTQSLVDLGVVRVVGRSADDLARLLSKQIIYVSDVDPGEIALPSAGIRLRPRSGAETRPGGDLVVRLGISRRIVDQLGARFFSPNTDNADLVRLAREGMVVSPVSSLIVLESEKDYRRFGIEDGSLLGQSKLEEPGASPEPGLALLVLLIVAGLAARRLLVQRRVQAA
ncbi:MAG: XrtN system VIT domain-containing protein [Spirochaetia bacterium]|nr:XrtN system VIT domain-containing protein [Spirochaetia bacterium]